MMHSGLAGYEVETEFGNKFSVQDKIANFNKPETNEEEEREQQRKKASFNSKFAKFEAGGEVNKKDTATKEKAKMFEDVEGKEEKAKEDKYRKAQFDRTKEKFKE